MRTSPYITYGISKLLAILRGSIYFKALRMIAQSQIKMIVLPCLLGGIKSIDEIMHLSS